ncbi:unnamed protein product [Blepharisma stoltei]|uniref:VHS domain-containing protein n=1 Tax=Blepharisma stoltei TaxID=1481888 RepID=A0AAU9K6I4_9CILI|nr:unnamed protein product [Blepharisma stoltei]
MQSSKPLDLIRMGCISDEEYERAAPQLADIIKTAQMAVCRDVISLIKKIIKDKHAAPPAKLRALKLFHACMMVANTHFLIFAQKKVMSRFTILAKHRKQIHEDNRGDDMFGSVSGASDENREASREFLICLLQYIQTWAQRFGKAPDGKSSAYYNAYTTLTKENVTFPKRSSRSKTSSENHQRPLSATPKQNNHMMYEGNSPGSLVASHTIKNTGGSLQVRAESTISLYNDLKSSGGDREMISECFLQLKQLKKEIERELENSDNPENIGSLLDINDRLQMITDTEQNFAQDYSMDRKKYDSAPSIQPLQPIRKQEPNNILDLDLFGSPPTIPSSQSPSFSSMNYATYNPRLQMMPSPDPYSQDYPALSPTLAKATDSDTLRLLKQENETLKKRINSRQDDDINQANQLNLLMTENMQLKQAFEAVKQQMFMQEENLRNLTAAGAQINASLIEANQSIEKLTKLLEIKENELQSLRQGGQKQNGYQASISQQSLPMNPNLLDVKVPPKRGPESQNSSLNPFDSDSSNDIPAQPHNFPIQNALFYRICNTMDRGILYDDESFQVGIQIVLNESEIMGMIYIGNKTPVPVTEINTEVTSYDKEGLIVLISPIISTDTITQGAQANRMLKVSLKDFTGKIPKIIIKIKQGSDNKTLFLNLPITIARFLQGIQRPPEEFWSIWERLAFKEEKFSCQMQGIRSMQELTQHLSLAGAFKIYSSQEIPQLSQIQLFGAGQKGAAVFFLCTIDPQTMSAQLSVRSENLKLRESLLEVISAQISGKE